MNMTNLTAAALMLSALSVKATTVVSPDSQFALEVNAALTIVDKDGQPVFTLVQDTRGDSNIVVAWSQDSQRVVVVETSDRGSDIVAAWRENNIWHRTIEQDEDLAGVIRLGEGKFSGRLISEKRQLGGWISNDAITVAGEMTFSGDHNLNYSYTLQFTHGPVTLSPGGYEDGGIVGRDYTIL